MSWNLNGNWDEELVRVEIAEHEAATVAEQRHCQASPGIGPGARFAATPERPTSAKRAIRSPAVPTSTAA